MQFQRDTSGVSLFFLYFRGFVVFIIISKFASENDENYAIIRTRNYP